MKKIKTVTPEFSKCIENLLSVLSDAQKDSAWSEDMLRKMDLLTQDYLHSLELEDLDYRERAKIATKLTQCRQERRAHKDTVTILEPIVTFLSTEKGKQLINLLNEALGKTRKAEERIDSRIYFPRVLDISPIKRT